MKNRGQLFLIVGNSGSGKDSLLREVLRRWPATAKPVRVPRRYITRPAHDSEPFISLTSEEFEDLKQRDQFCLTWHVYQTDYGIPATILDWLHQGQHVVINVSRRVIPQARQQIPDLKVIFVSVPLEITLQRLNDRRREFTSDPLFQQRLHRAQEHQTLQEADWVVDNSGPLNVAAEKLLNYLLSFG